MSLHFLPRKMKMMFGVGVSADKVLGNNSGVGVEYHGFDDCNSSHSIVRMSLGEKSLISVCVHV